MRCLFAKVILFLLLLSQISSNEIKIGMSADFSSSISYLGNNMKIGVLSYLNSVNETSQTKFKLISYDDKYNPLIASQNVRKLISEDKVIAFLGNVGTPTANVVIPILNDKKVVLLGAYSGGNSLREKNSNEYIFNYRASYSQEAYLIAKKLFELGIKANEIAVFSQNDTYGDSGYYGVVKALQEKGFADIRNLVHGRYTRGTLNIESALSKMLDFDVNFKAIILVSVDEPSIKFIKYAKEDFPKVKFITLSPTDIKKLSKKLPLYVNDIYTTQVVPLLLKNENVPIVEEYKRDLKKYYPKEEANLISFEGYIIAKLFVKSLEGLDKNALTSEKIYKVLKEKKNIDIGLAYSSSFQNSSHQYSNKVWLTTVRDKKIVETDLKGVFGQE